MKYRTFEDFLKNKHAEDYHGVDDDMPDDYENWVIDLTTDDIIKYADEYAEYQKQEILDFLKDQAKKHYSADLIIIHLRGYLKQNSN